MLIRKSKFLKILWRFIHISQNYPKLNNGHHTKLRNLYVCYVKILYLDNFVTHFSDTP